MNDASETTYFWSAMKQAKEEFLSIDSTCVLRKKFIKDFLSTVKYMDEMELFGQRYLLSFSTEPDSLSMWNYYGKNDGYCMGFVANELKAEIIRQWVSKDWIEDLDAFLAADVIYNEKRQVDILLRDLEIAFDWCLKQFGNFEKQRNRENLYNGTLINLGLRFLEYMSFFKHPGFKDEKEFRIFIRLSKESNQVKFRPYQGVMVPYIKLNFVNKRKGVPLECINVGH